MEGNVNRSCCLSYQYFISPIGHLIWLLENCSGMNIVCLKYVLFKLWLEALAYGLCCNLLLCIFCQLDTCRLQNIYEVLVQLITLNKRNIKGREEIGKYLAFSGLQHSTERLIYFILSQINHVLKWGRNPQLNCRCKAKGIVLGKTDLLQQHCQG